MIKKNVTLMFYSVVIAVCANWGSEQTTVEGRKKNKINIRGVLETHQTDDKGNPRRINVDNIAFGKLYEKIPVYAKPSPADYDPETRMLYVDPTKKYLKTFIDLVTDDGSWETAEIRVDNPQTVWKYKKKEYSSEVEYVEIVIKSNDQRGTEQRYIIDLNRKLTADELNDAGPKEMEVPIQSIKKLTIEGFSHRDAEKKMDTQKQKKKQKKQAPDNEQFYKKKPAEIVEEEDVEVQGYQTVQN